MDICHISTNRAGSSTSASVPKVGALRSTREFTYLISSSAKRRHRIFGLDRHNGVFTRIPYLNICKILHVWTTVRYKSTSRLVFSKDRFHTREGLMAGAPLVCASIYDVRQPSLPTGKTFYVSYPRI
jgi:hypothetical protein